MLTNEDVPLIVTCLLLTPSTTHAQSKLLITTSPRCLCQANVCLSVCCLLLLPSHADDKLSEMGLDIKAIQQQLSSGSLTSKAKTKTASTSNTTSTTSSSPAFDFTKMQTHGYCPQEVAAGQAAKARCLQAMAGVSDKVLQLISVTPAASLVEHGVYIRPFDSISADSFGSGRVVVMGDAAHPLRPTGQGYNQTVEDAYGLGVALAGSTSGGSIDLTRLQVGVTRSLPGPGGFKLRRQTPTANSPAAAGSSCCCSAW